MSSDRWNVAKRIEIRDVTVNTMLSFVLIFSIPGILLVFEVSSLHTM
jgi:hypothetical protein